MACLMREAVGELVIKGVVEAAFGVADGEADARDAGFHRSEFAVVVGGHTELSDAEDVRIEVGVRPRIEKSSPQ